MYLHNLRTGKTVILSIGITKKKKKVIAKWTLLVVSYLSVVSAEVFLDSSFAVYPMYISWLKTDAVFPTMLSNVYFFFFGEAMTELQAIIYERKLTEQRWER